MRRLLSWRIPALLVVLVVLIHAAVSAQAPAAARRPLGYKDVDYWHAIQGQRLSADGQWLAYSVTSQAEDGELVVRNLASGQEFKHPRGTGAQFTQDARFVVFTIAQLKAEAEKERLNEAAQGQASGEGRAAGGGAASAGSGQAPSTGSGQSGRGGTAARNQPRTGLGIMSLPDGTASRMVTNGEGRKQGLILRYRSLDPEERVVPATTPLLLSATDDRTRASGFYRVPLTGAAAPEKLVMMDKAFGAPAKASKADVTVFTLSRFEEFPDLWVSDTSFRNPKKVSNANPQQADFVWGRSEIIEYTNADGRRLRAILTKPDNFDPSKKYPLMVYIYEELTQGLHSFSAPNVGTSINITRYVSNGYIMLRPDIVYATGYPGESAEKCVIPAVQAGASVSNMVSAYGGIRWGTGMVRQFQYEKTQSRIGAPPWDAPLQFIENSPIFWVKKVNTPYLTIHNDGDDAVPWYQGIEFNMALRRLGKEAYMFNYNGEPHGLRNRDNMKHWTVHMDEFFDHYLLGRPRPEWMDKGVSFLERGRRDVAPMFKR